MTWEQFLATLNRAGFAWKNLIGQTPERGSWTPSITFGTPGGFAATYGKQVGYWERVGKLTKAYCWVQASSFSLSATTGIFSITGFPFKADNLTDYYPGGSCVWEGISASGGHTQLTPFMAFNDAGLYMDASGIGLNHHNIDAGDFSNGVAPEIVITILFSAKE